MDDVGLYQRLFAIGPECLVHDLHPDYVTTRYARDRAEAEEVELLAVQHHHAHMASCIAENRLTEPVIGVTFDGTGHGTDGKIWGGEFLVGDYRRFRRAAHLRPVGMPGGDRAIREPWRMAVAHLADAGLESAPGASPFPEDRARLIRRMLERRLNTAMTSSAGRLFDAVAALAGVRACVRYEGQAAIELEWLASGVAPDGAYPFEFHPGDGGADAEPALVVDTRPLVRAAADDASRGVGPARIARRFHSTIVEIIATVCGQIRAPPALDAAVLSGGVFLNALLSSEVCRRLAAEGFRTYRHRLVPTNDGGLSLGQLAVAVCAHAS